MVIFRDSFGKKYDACLEMEKIKEVMTNSFEKYWRYGRGDATIFRYDDFGKTERSLLIGVNVGYGVYLQYNCGKITKLSLFDDKKLDVVIETEEETYASAGLFLPKEIAWKGIETFIMTGEMSPDITWVGPEIIPAAGNW